MNEKPISQPRGTQCNSFMPPERALDYYPTSNCVVSSVEVKKKV